ncbi:hypothetical protein DV532_28930 (plasmid) [Pseudomonas sp. Leaf58]|uniref:hypothetical protein n=1 Tax=Pseudomonas sp. Leaf58 TaxID=1736226 RepID=UPI0006F81BEC|nr:hypothetical protein [Pseudomonas sp. Leaf58]AYG48290.1 hypothetical protein DV532_28930 [Pseudomonas sp. Leaf58]KQN62163.1 hypothetical protein ASF02_08340 [Pseudomonas sp. Leaf58]
MFSFALVSLVCVALMITVLNIAMQAYVHQSTLAQANGLVAQGAQIAMAVRIFKSDGHLLEEYASFDRPSRLFSALQEQGYLKTIPVPYGGGDYEVMALDVGGRYGVPRGPSTVVATNAEASASLTDKLCKEFNRRHSDRFGCLKDPSRTGNLFWYLLG